MKPTQGLHPASLLPTLLLSLCLFACGDSSTPANELCDVTCGSAGYGSADEVSTLEATTVTLTCSCQGRGPALTEMACKDYCSGVGGDQTQAKVSMQSNCICPGVPRAN